MNPVLIVIAGPNGSGKTTITMRLKADHWSADVEYLNPDDVARDRFGDWNSAEASLSAARWTQQRREDLLASRASIAFETVLSSAEKLDFIAKARDAGYFVRAFFVGTSDPQINAARVTERFMCGGHCVPIDKIVSRYGRSLVNLRVLRHLAHRTYIYDNSIDGAEARLCVRLSDGKVRKIYGRLPEWVASATLAAEHHERFEDLRVTG